MYRPVLQGQSDDPLADAILHDQVEREIFDEVVAVVAQRHAVQGVQDAVAGSVRHRTAPVRLAPFAELERLAAEGALVDPALLGPGEGHAVVLELGDGLGRLAGHVVYGVLVAQPV